MSPLMRVPDPVVMGVVNVTPDSFSDGGRWLDPEKAIAHAHRLVADGAGILDIGGESTRPGANPVAADEQLRRIVPVFEGLQGVEARLSIDTTKASVARAAIDAGADIVNDVTALRDDPDLAGLCAERGVNVCLMHMLGEPRTMQDDPHYDDVVDDIKAFLVERLEHAVAAGIAEDRVWLDPGIGFGKTVDHNLALLGRLDELVAIGRPIVVGTSRKGFIGRISGEEIEGRVPGTIATNVIALGNGAEVFRVHDVAAVAQALDVAAATFRGQWNGATTTSTTSTTSVDEEPVDDSDDEDDDVPDTPVSIEISGLSLYTHHGVSAAEREVGQRLVLDITLDMLRNDATTTDDVADTVDYGEVCQLAALIAQQRSYRTLERLATAIADRLLDDFDVHSVMVKASKPEPPIPLPVDEASVTVWREIEE